MIERTEFIAMEFERSYLDVASRKTILDTLVKNVIKETEEKHREAIMFLAHLKSHPEVILAPINKGKPMCKICGKTSEEIAGKKEGLGVLFG